MKLYLISLAVGLLVGGLCSLPGVRSPAPPAIALIGSLGLLIWERTVSMASRRIKGDAAPATAGPPAIGETVR